MPTLSVVLTAGQATKVSTAVGRHLMLGSAATQAQVEAYLKAHLKNLTYRTDQTAAAGAITDTFDAA